MENIFLQISVVMGITVSIALIMRLLRQPLIVAYIIAGLVAGPLFLNLVEGGKGFFDTFAQFGIVLLLFIVGLSLNFGYIKKMGRTVFIGALMQFLVTVVFGLGLMKIMHFGFLSSLFIAIAISFSSTIIVVKLLADKKDLETVYGRFTVGVLLVQDLLAIIIMVFLNTAPTAQGAWYNILVNTGLKGLMLVGAVFLLARYLLPWIMDRVARSAELLFIFTITWCFGIASLVYWAGFSVEIGAIIAGISLGSSPYQTEISSRIRPLRDFFIVLFFIVLGSELQLGGLQATVWPALILSVFVLIVDPLIFYFVMRGMKYTRHSALLASLTSAQVSEFGFILIFTAAKLGYLHGSELEILTLVALVTIVGSSYLITYNEKIYQKLLPLLQKFGKQDYPEQDMKKNYEVWVFGYHRIGWKVCEALAEKKVDFAVVDYSPEIIAKLKRRNIPAFFGDAADVEFLGSLPLEDAKMIISTIPEPDDQKTLFNHVRRLSKKTKLIGNLHYYLYLDDLYEAGADYVMMPHLVTGQWLAGIVRNTKLDEKTFKKMRLEQKEEMKLRFTAGTHE